MGRPSSWKALLFVAVALGAVSCIAFVDAEERGPHCAFRGRETDCGTCIQKRCESEVDSCCLEGDCGGLVLDVEACAAKSDARCDVFRAETSSADLPRRRLAACVMERCRGVCEKAPPSSSTTCTETKFGFGTACACRPAGEDSPANGYQCNATVFPNTRCCAPAGWPQAGNTCSCLAVSCSSLGNGCSCFLTDGYDPQALRTCEGPVCCQTDRNCYCGTSACRTSETQVASCSVETTPCDARTTAQPSGCSLP